MSTTGSRCTGAWAFGPQLDGAGTAPALVHVDVGQPPRRELADRGAPVDVVDGLQIDVLGEIEMRAQAAERVAALLVGHRAGEDVDPVPRDDADDEIAAMVEPGLAEFLRLAVHLAAMHDADVGGQKQIGRIGAADVVPSEPAADGDVDSR